MIDQWLLKRAYVSNYNCNYCIPEALCYLKQKVVLVYNIIYSSLYLSLFVTTAAYKGEKVIDTSHLRLNEHT